MFGRDNVYRGPIVRGTRVHCILYGGKDGVVTAAHGVSDPASCGSVGGWAAAGGRADYDVAFTNGVSRIGESMIRTSVQWSVCDGVATEEEVRAAEKAAADAVAAAEEKGRRDAERRAAERVEHVKNHPHLTPAASKPEWSRGRVAAENIRRELKRAFPGTKFKVTKDEHAAVLVAWTDGPTDAAVKAVTGRYEGGSFDSNEDVYKDNPDATFADVFGRCDYVFESRSSTTAAVAAAWEKAGFNPAEVAEKWEKGTDNDLVTHMRRVWAATAF
jgi:hypothetical protein